jgi:serine phosphatase RsbU (regulator of sigma subunit)/anti-sigma regulatory factor (Ser/Thr protein kinase)/anti-anti-sigma regulatory factor
VTGAAEQEALDSSAGDARAAREAFDQMPAMMVSLAGPQYLIRAANAALRAFIGRSDLIGLPLESVLPESARQPVFELLDRVRETSIAATGHERRVQLDHLAGHGPEAYLDYAVLPWLAADGSVLGVLASGTDVTARVAQRLADERSSADAEFRYQAALDLTASLQTALLPTAVPILPQARIAATYLVAGRADAAGGDWFDAIPVGPGTVAVVVGDVVGHGVSAAAAMAQLRAVLTELLIAEADAGVALDRLEAFAAREQALRAATLVLAIVEPATGAIRYATCGHPSPLIIGANGTTRYLESSGGGPLGIGSRQHLRLGTLGPGDALFLYSDGLIERPGRTLAESLSELSLVAADAAAGRLEPAGADAGAAERICTLTVEMLTRTGYADDVTALAIERLASRVPDLQMTVSSEANSLRVLRRALTDWIVPLQPRPDDLDAIHMAAVEIVTNAIEHAYGDAASGPIDFALQLTDGGELECRVADYGTWRPPTQAAAERGNGLMVARHLVDQLQVTHPRAVRGAAAGAPSTVVTLRHRLMSPTILAADASALPTAFGGEPDFGIVTEPAKDAVRALVLGAIDITTADQLLRRLLAVCKGGTLPLTVDLTGVTRLASAGVSALFELSRQLRLHEHSLALVASAGSQVQLVLDLVRLPHASAAS